MKDIEERETIAERGALIAEIMLLAYLVNERTEYCVFADFAGHVDSFTLKIARSKSAYNDEIASGDFRTKYSGDQPWKITPLDRLRAKRDHLKSILETGEIDVEGMDVVREVVETYEF